MRVARSHRTSRSEAPRPVAQLVVGCSRCSSYVVVSPPVPQCSGCGAAWPWEVLAEALLQAMPGALSAELARQAQG